MRNEDPLENDEAGVRLLFKSPVFGLSVSFAADPVAKVSFVAKLLFVLLFARLLRKAVVQN